MIFVLIVLSALLYWVFTFPRYEVKQGDTVVRRDRVWMVASEQGRRYVLIGNGEIVYDVPKRQIVVA